MGKVDINYYKLAPTWLFKIDGSKKLFMTQAEVDKAWKEGWYGPPWAIQGAPLLSTVTHSTKADLKKSVEDDPRYEGFSVNTRKSVEDIMTELIVFEQENVVDKKEG